VARRESLEVSGRGALALPAAAALALAVLAAPASGAGPGQSDVPYVSTPWVVVDAMIELAAIGPADYVIDLGSGDGRLVIAAAKRHGARGFGVDIDSALVRTARQEAKRQGVADRVEFVEENLFVTRIDRATVMTLYLFPRVMMELRPRFLAELRPGSRIVSHEFGLDEWRPDAQRTISVPDKPYGPPRSEVYLWIVPANAAGDWRWRSGDAGEITLMLAQTFQVLEGRTSVGGRPGRLEEGRMRGESIRFILHGEAGGRATRQEYNGRVSGDTITGTVRQDGVESEWKATRVRRGHIAVTGNG
jgi:SAM-dependent methyltransferase